MVILLAIDEARAFPGGNRRLLIYVKRTNPALKPHAEDAGHALPRRTKRSGEAIPPRASEGVTLTGTSTPIWYVTFEVRRRGILPKQRSPRETRTFATEAEAKIFARSRLNEGLIVYAGTINPHTPKRLVPSSQIDSWLADVPINDESIHGEKKE